MKTNQQESEHRVTNHELIEESKKHTPHRWPAAQRDEKPYCDYCSTSWPCLTSRLAGALEAADSGVTKVRREALDWARSPAGIGLEARYVGSYLLTLLPSDAAATTRADGLTETQADLFRMVERFDISDDLRVQIEMLKADQRKKNAEVAE